MALPNGRGFYIWRIPKCENGDVSAIVAKCRVAGVEWLAVKAGNAGRAWSQFSPALVTALHAQGIRVYGWSYDIPDRPGAQAKVIDRVCSTGADGFIIDAEVEWDRHPSPDSAARAYVDAIRALNLPADFTVADAPWDTVRGHPKFPFTEFGRLVAFRSVQAYWVAHGISVRRTWDRFVEQWGAYERALATSRGIPEAVKPHIPGGSLWNSKTQRVTPEEVALFEQLACAKGCAGVLYWVWDSCPPEIWTALSDGTVPKFGAKK